MDEMDLVPPTPDPYPEPDWAEAADPAAAFDAHLDSQVAFDYDSHYFRSALEFELPEKAEPKAGPLPVGKPRKGVTKALADIAPEPVHWLWPGRIALGTVTILDGDPGVGKTTLAIDIGARVTRGLPLPFEESPQLPPSPVLLLSAEDNPATTLRPRAAAAGASLGQFFVALEHCWLPTEATKLQQMIHDTHARYVILDPGIAFFDSKIDSNSDQQTRRVLQGLSDIAAATHAAIVFVRHLNKAQRSSAMYRGGGSIAIAAAARNCLLAKQPPKSTPILASYKSSLSAAPASISYEVIGEASLSTSRIRWLQVVDMTADETLAGDEPKQNRGGNAAKDARLEDLRGRVLDMINASGAVGASVSRMRPELKARATRIYEVLTQLMTEKLVRVDGEGPSRRYFAHPALVEPPQFEEEADDDGFSDPA